MNKKGFLLANETVKIVIGMIGIALLVYLLFAIYFSSSTDKKLIEAEAVLEKVKEATNHLKLDNSFKAQLTEITPVGWWIFSFVDLDIKPNSCSGDNCVCICAKSVRGVKQVEKCLEKGKCLVIDELDRFGAIKIKKGGKGFTSIEISEINNKVVIKEI